MYFMQIYFYPLWFGNKFTDSVVFTNFLLTLHTIWHLKESKIFRRLKSQDDKAQFKGKQYKSDYERESSVF